MAIVEGCPFLEEIAGCAEVLHGLGSKDRGWADVVPEFELLVGNKQTFGKMLLILFSLVRVEGKRSVEFCLVVGSHV